MSGHDNCIRSQYCCIKYSYKVLDYKSLMTILSTFSSSLFIFKNKLECASQSNIFSLIIFTHDRGTL